ncbi:MAG TPA: hypothetical protein VMQ40_06135 [Acidimicrobiales bacterium]|jgi:hypothetical protein|nr:hypothetical protein [Acidimicrobiales bacterium]
MVHTISRSARAIGLGAASFGLVVASLAMSQPSSASPKSTPTLDHFLCYKAVGKGFTVPKGVQLANQLQPTLFTPTFGAVAFHCNPANKSVPRGVFLARHPKAHLLCWAIAYPNFPQTAVSLTNQFGQGDMTASPPTRLCLPTWKSLTGPPKESTKEPAGLDHFTCYPLTVLPGAYAFHTPAFVKVEDQFSFPKYVAVKIGVANLLCVPTVKVVKGVVYKIQAATDKSLMCFPEFTTPIKPQVYDLNQFGTGRVFLTKAYERLCLPTVVKVTTRKT